MLYKEPSGTQESAGHTPEKIVVHVKTISEIPDGYDAAESYVQYVADGLGYSEIREHGT